MKARRTPLYEAHKALGARFVDFAGWEMPVRYTDVIDEHMAVRKGAGLFDVSHMGEIEVSGPGALAAVQHLITNDITRASDGQCQYTLLCNERGGVVDDCIVYRISAEKFLFCVNASNTSKVFVWFRENLKGDAEVVDRSSDYAQIAVQGPASDSVIKPLLGVDPGEISLFRFIRTTVAGDAALVSRTGYTGEDGFEIYTSPESARKVWDGLLESGAGAGIKPVGLGARDTLRLEAGLPLYGHELTDDTTPVEAGLLRFIALEKEGFIGRPVLAAQVEDGVTRRLAAFEMEEKGVPREGYEVRFKGEPAGAVTSGTLSPVLKKGIGMAYLKSGCAGPGKPIEVMIRGRGVAARTVKRPFYKRGAVAGM